MDFSMFDDEQEDVGQEIEAYCARCKTDTPHTVVSRYEDEIRRVRCNTCEDIHAFRKPRGEDAEEPEAPVRKKAVKAKPTWDQIMAKKKKEPRVYNVNEVFTELEVVNHPTFGVGFVSEMIGRDKIEVTFQQDKRILVHNRQGLSLSMVQRQRQEAEAKAKADGKARARELREAKEAARLAKEALHVDEDLIELPDEIHDELPGADLEDLEVPEPVAKMKPGRSTKLSPRALAALDEEEEPEEFAEDADAEEGRGKRGPGRARGKAEKTEKPVGRGRKGAAEPAAAAPPAAVQAAPDRPGKARRAAEEPPPPAAPAAPVAEARPRERARARTEPPAARPPEPKAAARPAARPAPAVPVVEEKPKARARARTEPPAKPAPAPKAPAHRPAPKPVRDGKPERKKAEETKVTRRSKSAGKEAKKVRA